MRWLIPFLISAAALYAPIPSASAFTSQPANPVSMSNKLADPDDVAEQISKGPSPLVQQGGTLQFSAPIPSADANHLLWSGPSTVLVPSQRR